MAAEFVNHDELKEVSDNLIGYVDLVVDKSVRASEKRLRSEIQESEARLRLEILGVAERLQDFRERHDFEMAQVHTELGRINEMLLYIVQRLPIQPIQSPPAQFLSHEQ